MASVDGYSSRRAQPCLGLVVLLALLFLGTQHIHIARYNSTSRLRLSLSSNSNSETPAVLHNVVPTQQTWDGLLRLIVQDTVPPSSITPVDNLGDIGSREVCEDLQRATPAGKCVEMSNPNSQVVLLCLQRGNSHGTLLIHGVDGRGSSAAAGVADSWANWADSAAHTAHDVFRVRLVGPEILQPAVHYCGRLAVAPFELTLPGRYTLVVTQLYSNFTYEAPPFVLSDVRVANHSFDVELPPHACGVGLVSCKLASTSSQLRVAGLKRHQDDTGSAGDDWSRRQLADAKPCTACTGFNHNGRWVAASQADPQLLGAVHTALQEMCVFRYAPPPDNYFGCPTALQRAAVPDIEDHPVLEWLPYSCQYQKVTPAIGARCKASLKQQRPNNHVCFIGDSQTRHLFNQVVHLLEGEAAGYRKQVSGIDRAYQVLGSDILTYIADNYGNASALWWDTSNCSHVFVNFGHWPLSFQETQPWPAQRFAAQVLRLAKSMQAQRQRHGNEQYWLTLGPTPLLDYHQHKTYIRHGVDWRTDPFILKFNKIAATVMQAHNIPVVDIHSIASPLFDLSYDANHYIGSVGLAQANMVANIICSDVLQHAHPSADQQAQTSQARLNM